LGSVEVHSGGNPSQGILFNNESSSVTTVESVRIVGPDAASFSVAYGNCAHDNLSQSNTCDENVRFSPTSPGEKTAEIAVTSDATLVWMP
jgi:hypothetical protein